jgi:pyruvate-ferredoxin/flavodoxin oxidoreductase
VVDLVMFRPFPADLLAKLLRGKRAGRCSSALDQPLAVDLPLMREIRATLGKCLENGRAVTGAAAGARAASPPTASSPTPAAAALLRLLRLGSRDLQPEGMIGAVENMLPTGRHKKLFYLSIDFLRDKAAARPSRRSTRRPSPRRAIRGCASWPCAAARTPT